MFNNKKGRMVRHPYVALAIIGLATAGAVTIGNKVKGFFVDKMPGVKSMMNDMRHTL